MLWPMVYLGLSDDQWMEVSFLPSWVQTGASCWPTCLLYSSKKNWFIYPVFHWSESSEPFYLHLSKTKDSEGGEMADLILLKPSHYSTICLLLTKCCFEIYPCLWEEKGNFGCICFVKMKYLVKTNKKKSLWKKILFFGSFFLFSIIQFIGNKCSLWKKKLRRKRKILKHINSYHLEIIVNILA